MTEEQFDSKGQLHERPDWRQFAPPDAKAAEARFEEERAWRLEPEHKGLMGNASFAYCEARRGGSAPAEARERALEARRGTSGSHEPLRVPAALSGEPRLPGGFVCTGCKAVFRSGDPAYRDAVRGIAYCMSCNAEAERQRMEEDDADAERVAQPHKIEEEIEEEDLDFLG